MRQELDSSEDVDAVNSYRPFGLPLEGNGGDPYGFTGEWWDGSENRGLLFLRARYDEPEVGRFFSPDTIVPYFSHPQSIHRFTYVYNNPLRYTDPSGHGIKEEVEKAVEQWSETIQNLLGTGYRTTATKTDYVYDWLAYRMPGDDLKATYQTLGLFVDWFLETDDPVQEFGPDLSPLLKT